MSKPTDKTTTVHVNIDKDVLRLFDEAYPSCRRRFIENAMKLATTDKIFFDKIFFKDIYSNRD